MSDAEQSDWLKQIERSYMQASVQVSNATDAVTAYYTIPRPDRVAELEAALATAAAQNSEANQRLEGWSAHCADQERKIAALREALDLAHRTNEQLRASMQELPSDPPAGGDDVVPGTAVDQVIDQLDKRLVGRTDRTRLRGALDRADAPATGRAGADEALGRVTRWVAPGSAMDWATKR